MQPTPRARMRIGQLASLAGATPDTLRYYERLGLLPRPTRTNGGYRLYEPAALERIALIRKAHALGLTLREVREVLEIASGGRDPCAHVRALLERRLGEIQARIADLRSLERTLGKVLAEAQHSPPNRTCVCKIIESQEMRNAEFGMRNRATQTHSTFRTPHSAFKRKDHT